ncbi:MAG: hypothetical protein LIP03_12625 [Bacteroidales bacterium]|nr:hypothetical protein [Bacteroidales bacterium]
MIFKRIFIGVIASVASVLAGAQPRGEESTLSLDVDGTLFFRDCEFDAPQMRGYSLPGFRLHTDLIYRPAPWVSLQAGVWMMHYWGSDRYPNHSYIGIPEYSETNTTKGVHVQPFLRLEMSTPQGITVVLGDVLQRDGHGLLQQIYSPELLLTADPEVGAQVLYNNRWFEWDLWLDWKTFIYHNSPYQENFFVGLSTRFKYNSADAPVHFYSPLQALVEHRGGEIDTITDNSVQTFVNAAAGLGARFRIDRKHVRAVTIEADGLYSWQQAGQTWHYKKGWGMYAQAALELKYADIKVGYFGAKKYNTILGYYLWGSASERHPDQALRNPSSIYLGFDYRKEMVRGFWLGGKVDLYQGLGSDAVNILTGEKSHFAGKTNFAFELSMTFAPSFLLKRFPPAHSRR